MIFVFSSSELHIKDKHSNDVKFSNGDCVINNTLITNFIRLTASLISPIDFERMFEFI